VLLKVAVLYRLGGIAGRAVLAAPVCGRWAAVYAIALFPPARPDGLGRMFHDHVRRSDLAIATLWTVAIAGAAVPSWRALSLLVLWPFVHALARRITKSLGGLTGDVHGLLIELSEVVALLALAARG
jgi:adenosylcobinamide-GDP ribazoletransferase